MFIMQPSAIYLFWAFLSISAIYHSITNQKGNTIESNQKQNNTQTYINFQFAFKTLGLDQGWQKGRKPMLR